MSVQDSDCIFICSFCEQLIKFKTHQEGKRIACPKCGKAVHVFANQSSAITNRLFTEWYFKRPRVLMILGDETVGPVSDGDFLQLIQRGEIDRETIVRSAQLTSNNEVPAGKLNLQIIREIQLQRLAEIQRVDNLTKRLTNQQNKNREILRSGVKQAIADGRISAKERTQLVEFAAKTGIAHEELESFLATESLDLLKNSIEESLSDGLLDATEREQISKLAVGLGLANELSDDHRFRMELCEFAWKLLHEPIEKLPDHFCSVELFEIVALKRPAGIAVGDDHYLKSLLTGECNLNDKQLMVNGKFASKKFALNSVADVQWFADGIFCRRSTGKSLFIRPLKSGIGWCKFAMLLQSFVTQQPVLGILPEDNFIPVSTNVLVNEPNPTLESSETTSDDVANDSWKPSMRHPRYTFRVVGEQYGNRYEYLSRLRYSDAVFFQPEPNNPHDKQAIAVVNSAGNSLGYLKREVSEWFEPILRRGKKYQCEVFRKLESGGIVIALYE